MEWMLMPFKRYADFNGRSRRMEYWMFSLFILIVVFVLALITGLLGAFSGGGDTIGAIFLVPAGLFVLATIIPSIAVTVRRFHDQDKSGWFYLLSFIPYLGGIIVFVFMCLEGTSGPNQYGPDPKGGDANIFS